MPLSQSRHRFRELVQTTAPCCVIRQTYHIKVYSIFYAVGIKVLAHRKMRAIIYMQHRLDFRRNILYSPTPRLQKLG